MPTTKNTNTKDIKKTTDTKVVKSFDDLRSMTKKPISILGQGYSFVICNTPEDKDLPIEFKRNEAIAFCNICTKQVFISKFAFEDHNPEELAVDLRATVRHEIIHAFLAESGLDSQTSSTSAWARNEEMVDWLALQYPKIEKVFKSIGVNC